jgi:5-formyltetrahydrofolate cyclo-ligase
MDKKALRQEIHSLFKKMEDSAIQDLSRKVSDLMTEQTIWQESEQILIFLSFGKEFETSYLIKSADKAGKLIAVPRIYGKKMKFHYLSGLNDKLEINRLGIRELYPEAPQWTGDKGKTLMLTPGLAFGPSGSRLGRGGGYYDRFLALHGNKIQTIGLSFESQFRDDIPMEDFDRPLDGLCTEKRFLLF